jgi:hypothetical protein
VLALSVESAGCRFATNGSLTASVDDGLLAQIKVLLSSPA